jgi:cell wall-associated protein
VPKSFNESKTTTQVQGRTSKDADGNKISTYEFDLYTVDDEQIASNIFEFLAKNSDVEWSNTKVSSKDNTSFNLISTSHKEGSEVGMRYTFEKYKNNYNFTIDYAIHSHLPESVGFSPGDIKFAKDAKSIYPNIELKIYNRIEYKRFDQYDIPGVLNEVVVTPQKR